MADPIKSTNISQLKEDNKNTVKDIKSDPERKSTIIPQKDVRMQRRMNRESVRDAKDENAVVNTANKNAIDLNNLDTLPVTGNYQKKLSGKLSNLVKKEDRDKLNSFVTSIPKPNYIDQPKIDVDEEKRKARIQRKAVWGDALSAFGTALSGGQYDPKNSAFNRIQRSRDTDFQNFKKISETNKQTEANWKYNSRKEALDWIDKQLAGDALSEAERKKYQATADKLGQEQSQFEDELGFKNKELASRERIAKINAASRQKPSNQEKMATNTERYFGLSGNSPKLLNEFAKYTGHPMDDSGNVKLANSDYERYATSLLGQMFDTDSEGNMVPKPGKENFINDINNKIAAKDQKQKELEVKMSELETKKADNSGLGKMFGNDSSLNEQYQPKFDKLQTEINELDEGIKNMFGGQESSTQTNETPNTPQLTEEQKSAIAGW